MLLALTLACANAPYAVDLDAWQYWVYAPEELPEGAPAVVHLHHSGDGRELAESPDIQRQLTEAGMLGVFPMGGGVPGDDWRVGVNKDDITRDDRGFVADVGRDLRATRDDLGDLWLSGYSKGGAMTYDYACLGEPVYAGFLPMSGAFEDWVHDTCSHDARPIRHLQGADDDKWPVRTEDDPESSHEGIIDSLAGLQAGGECVAAEPVEADGCLVWDACEVDVRLCFFDGGHEKPDDWLLAHRAWIDGL